MQSWRCVISTATGCEYRTSVRTRNEASEKHVERQSGAYVDGLVKLSILREHTEVWGCGVGNTRSLLQQGVSIETSLSTMGNEAK